MCVCVRASLCVYVYIIIHTYIHIHTVHAVGALLKEWVRAHFSRACVSMQSRPDHPNYAR